MKKWIEKLKDKIKSGQINIRTIVIAVVVIACVAGTVAATQITSPNKESNQQSKISQDEASITEQDDSSNDKDDDKSSTVNSSKTQNGATDTNSDNTSAKNETSTKSSSDEKETSDSNTGNATSASDSNNISSKTDSTSNKKNISCTIEIRCDSVSGNQKLTNNGHPELETYAANPQILYSTISIAEGSSAYDVLIKACQEKGVQTDCTYTTAYKSYYVKGINYLYEFSAGPNSGWAYRVNGTSPNYGCSSYKVSEGDSIVFHYVTSY